MDLLAHQPRRTVEKYHDKQDEGEGVAVARKRREECDEQNLHEAEQKPAYHRALHRAYAPEHRGDEGLKPRENSHKRMNLRIAQRPHDARAGRERGADREGQRYDSVDLDAHQPRRLDVARDGAHREPRLRAVEHPQKRADKYERNDRNENDERQNPDVAERYDLYERLETRHRLRHSRENYEAEVLDEERDAYRRNQRGDARRGTQRAIGHPVDHKAKHRRRSYRKYYSGNPRHIEHSYRDEYEVGAYHKNIAVGEVDEPQNAVDHRIAYGDEAVKAPQHQSVEKMLDHHI